MEKSFFKDKSGTMILMGAACFALMNANSSMPSGMLNAYPNGYVREYGNVSTTIKEYKLPVKKLKVETEAKRLFGEMREASKAEQMAVQKNIDKISKPTGLSFLSYAKGICGFC